MKKVRSLVLVVLMSLVSMSAHSNLRLENLVTKIQMLDGDGVSVSGNTLFGGLNDYDSDDMYYNFVFLYKVDIYELKFRYIDEFSGQSIDLNPNSVWEGLVLEFLTDTGSIIIDGKNIVDETFSVDIPNAIGLVLRFTEFDDTKPVTYFYMRSVLSPVITQDTIDSLNSALYVMGDNLQSAQDFIVQLTNENYMLKTQVDSLNNIIDSLYVVNGLLTDSLPIYYDNGWDVGYDVGFEDGVVSVDTMVFYNNGYTQGQADCDGTSNKGQIAPQDLNVYPNPVNSNSTLYIETEDLDFVEIYTTSGSMVYSTTEAQFNLNGFDKGLYLVRVYNDRGLYSTKKITIE